MFLYPFPFPDKNKGFIIYKRSAWPIIREEDEEEEKEDEEKEEEEESWAVVAESDP